jgi:hypothetical protein
MRLMAMTALDYEEIRQLLARYSVSLDFGDVAAFQMCFEPDGTFAETGLPLESPQARFEGRESIGEFVTRFIAAARGHVRHWSSLPLIEGDGHHATGVSFLMVLRPGSSPGAGVILTGVYRDRYTKTDGQWFFAAREFTADPQTEHRETPSKDPLVARFDEFVAAASRS